ncbi:type VII secretion protein EsaA [Streptococcus rifensis]
MMKIKGIALLKLVLAVVIFTGLLLFLNLQVSQRQKETDVNRQEQESHMNVAIVNEDQGGEFEGNVYNLARNYVKQLEKNTDHNWTVVSRSSAERGLENGTYQLAVFIPNNFTNKLLDINAVAPEKTLIYYKVNASGNATMEKIANQTGDKIVSDLNQQLVDMFMASILGNLYTAQKNVQSVVDNQGKNIATYESSIYNNAINFRNGLPNLMENAQNSWLSNAQLISNLIESNTLYEGIQTTQGEYNDQLGTLIEQRASGEISYQEFMARLFEMNNLVSQSEALYSVVSANQENLEAQLSEQETGAIGLNSASYTDLQELLARLQEQKDTLSNKVDTMSQGIKTSLASYYNLTEAEVDDLTVAEFIAKNDSEKSAELNENISAIHEVLQRIVSQVPAFDFKDIAPYFALSHFDQPSAYNSEEVSKTYTGLSANVALAEDFKEAYEKLAQKQSSLENETKTSSFVLNNSDGAFDGMTLEVSAINPAVTIESISHSGQQGRLAREPITITYTYKVSQPQISGADAIRIFITVPSSNNPDADAPASTTIEKRQIDFTYMKDDGTEVTEPREVEVAINHYYSNTDAMGLEIDFLLPADFSGYASQEYQDLLSDYNSLAGQVYQIYETAGALTKASTNLTTLSSSLNLPISQYLTDIIQHILTPTLQEQGENLDLLDANIKDLNASMDSLTIKLEDIETQTQSSGESIASLLSHYVELTDKVAELQNAQESDESSQSALTTNLQALMPEFAALSSNTQEVASNTLRNLSEAEAVRSTLDQFENSISSAESSATDLSSQAEGLMTAFNDELSKNQDFVGAFVKVLSNAYNDGVPNEVLLDFLSSPVRQESQATKTTTNVYKPFTWVLLIDVIALMTAYLFSATHLFSSQKDPFKRSSNPLLQANSKTIIISQLLAVLLGLLIGLASLNQLTVDSNNNGLWVFSIVLIILFLTQWHYLLLKYLKASGMGIALFILVTYIYLTSAVGTTASLSGLPLWVRRTNILAYFESLLSGYFVDKPAPVIGLFLITLGLIGGIAIGLFVSPRTSKKNETSFQA